MTETITHSGAWGIAATMIVLISWVMYRWLAPRNWREWGSAGIPSGSLVEVHLGCRAKVLPATNGEHCNWLRLKKAMKTFESCGLFHIDVDLNSWEVTLSFNLNVRFATIPYSGRHRKQNRELLPQFTLSWLGNKLS